MRPQPPRCWPPTCHRVSSTEPVAVKVLAINAPAGVAVASTFPADWPAVMVLPAAARSSGHRALVQRCDSAALAPDGRHAACFCAALFRTMTESRMLMGSRGLAVGNHEFGGRRLAHHALAEEPTASGPAPAAVQGTSS